MRVANWAPDKITAEIEKKAMDRLYKAGQVVADRAYDLCPVGKAVKQSGSQAWTERIPGTLRSSIRVVRLAGDPKQNIRVYAGSRGKDVTAFYAHMVEHGTVKMRARPFMRPALNASKSAIMSIVENG